MRRSLFFLCAALLCGALIYALSLRSAPLATVAATETEAVTATPVPNQEPEVLFGNLDPNVLDALSIRTPECSYEFRCADKTKISINGQKADREVFCTLLDQILRLPVQASEAFPLDDEPLATLELTIGEEKHTVSFYRSAEEAYAGVVSGSAEAPRYQKTDAWRIGTMLLTCEGTRIQDASGQETPVQ